MPWWGWVLLGIFFLVLAPGFFFQMLLARSLYFRYLVRGKRESWEREPKTDDPETIKIYEIGNKEFYQPNKHLAKEVNVTSCGFKLAGEYYDFGHKKTALIVAGRSEALTYSYYFAIPYQKLGFNILVIDNRGHGYSEGKINAVGLLEWPDILAWVKMLHDDFGQEEIISHGVCIGSATTLYALTSNDCPDYYKGMVADGMYQNFPLSFINHAYEAGYPKHFVYEFFFMWFKHYAKVNPFYGPIDCIDKLKVPILFIYSKEDRYSTPDKGQELFDKCSGPKEIAWFDKGRHSYVRINNQDGYDKAIEDFINKYNL